MGPRSDLWKLLYGLNIGWLVVFYVPSTARSFRDSIPIYCPLQKDAKLGFYTVLTGNRTAGRRVAVHYTTTAPRQLRIESIDLRKIITVLIGDKIL